MSGLGLCEELVRRAKALGADEAEVYYLEARELEAVFEKNDLQVPKGDRYEGVGVRVIRRRRQGFAASNVLASDSLDDTIRAAIAIAAASPEDESHCLPEPSRTETVAEIFDERIAALGLDDVLGLGCAFVEAAREFDSRFTMDSASFTAVTGRRSVANSNGVRATEVRTRAECMGVGFARDRDDISSFDVEYSISCVLSDIDPETTGRRLAEKVVRTLGAASVPSFRGPVVIAPLAASELVVEPVVFSVSADNVQNGQSQWKGKIGDQIGGSLLSILDDPRIARAVGSTSFDREGVPPMPLQLVERGTLHHYLYNCYTARKDGVRSNGRALGDDQNVPGTGITNLVLAPGGSTLEEMIAACKKGLLVNRFSGNVDPVSGDFSGVVKGGHYIENGAMTRPVKEVMIAGNIYELLKRVAAVSREVVELGDMRLPYIQIDGVSVTGR